MVLACPQGECRWESEDIGPKAGKHYVQFGKPEVVADFETDVPNSLDVHWGDDLPPGDDTIALARPLNLAFALYRGFQLDVEEVELAVSRAQGPVGTNQHVRVVHPYTVFRLA